MADSKIIKVTLKTVADISDVQANAKEIQKALNGLQLPQAVQAKLATLFSNIEKNAEKASQAMVNGFKSKGDVTKYEQATNQIVHDMQTLVQVMNRIDPSKLNFEINGEKAKQLTEEINNIKNAINTISTEKLNELKQTIGEPPSKAKAWNDFFDAISKGADGVDDAEKALNRLETQVKKADKAGYDMSKESPWGEYKAKVEELRKVLDALKAQLENLNQKEQERAGLQEEANDEGVKGYNDLQNAAKGAVDGAGQLAENEQKVAEETQNINSELEHFKSRITYFFGMANAVQLFRRALNAAFETVKELDKVMTQTAVVTDFSVGDMWSQLPEYTKRANELGVSIKGVYEAATLYYQQGLKTNEVMALTNETLKMARIAGLDAATATDRMTNALRGFNMEINETNAQRVNDVYSKLAAITASNTDEISTAMTKVASLANNANMSFETTAAFLSQIIETTRESAETAGTALKTIIARFSEVKKLYSEGSLLGTDEEGNEVDVNKVSQALRVAGINLNEYLTGNKDLGQIFIELASKWDSLDKVTQRYIATMAAGSRQQSRFIAMMSDYSRTTQLVNAANTAAGASHEQFNKTLESMESKLARLKNAWDSFTMSIANSSILKSVIDILEKLLDTINKMTDSAGALGGILKVVFAAILLKAGKSLATTLFTSIATHLRTEANRSGQEAGRTWGQGFIASVKKFQTTSKSQGMFNALFTEKVAGSQEFSNQAKKEFSKYLQGQTQGFIDNGQLTNPEAHEIRQKIFMEYETNGFESANELAKKHGLTLDELNKKAKQFTGTQNVMSVNFNKIGMAAIAVGSIFNLLGQAFDDGTEEGKETAQTISQIGSVIMGIGTALITVGSIAKTFGITVTKEAFKLGGSVAEAGVTAQIGWGWISLIALAIAALVAGTVAIVKQIKENSPEGRLKKLQEATEKAKETANKTAEAYTNLVTNLDKVTEYSTNIDQLTQGTKEWKEEVEKLNKQIIELVTNYPELAKYVTMVDGHLAWEEDSENAINAYKEAARQATVMTEADIIFKQRQEQIEQLNQQRENNAKTAFSKYYDKTTSAEIYDLFLTKSDIQEKEFHTKLKEIEKNAQHERGYIRGPRRYANYKTLDYRDAISLFIDSQSKENEIQKSIDGLSITYESYALELANIPKENQKIASLYLTQAKAVDKAYKEGGWSGVDLRTVEGFEAYAKQYYNVDTITWTDSTHAKLGSNKKATDLAFIYQQRLIFSKAGKEAAEFASLIQQNKQSFNKLGGAGYALAGEFDKLTKEQLDKIGDTFKNLSNANTEIANYINEDLKTYYSDEAQKQLDLISSIEASLSDVGITWDTNQYTSGMISQIGSNLLQVFQISGKEAANSLADEINTIRDKLGDRGENFVEAVAKLDWTNYEAVTKLSDSFEDFTDVINNFEVQIIKATNSFKEIDLTTLAQSLNSLGQLRSKVASGQTLSFSEEEKVLLGLSDDKVSFNITTGQYDYLGSANQIVEAINQQTNELLAGLSLNDAVAIGRAMKENDWFSQEHPESAPNYFYSLDLIRKKTGINRFNNISWDVILKLWDKARHGTSEEVQSATEEFKSIYEWISKQRDELSQNEAKQAAQIRQSNINTLQAKSITEIAFASDDDDIKRAALINKSVSLGISQTIRNDIANSITDLISVTRLFEKASRYGWNTDELNKYIEQLQILDSTLNTVQASQLAFTRYAQSTGYRTLVDNFENYNQVLFTTNKELRNSDQGLRALIEVVQALNQIFETDTITGENLDDTALGLIAEIAQGKDIDNNLNALANLLSVDASKVANFSRFADISTILKAQGNATYDVFTELDQINQQINDTLRERNKLEREYQKLLKQPGTSLATTQAALQKQVDTYYKEQEYQRQVIDYNKDQYQKLREKYGSNITRYATLNESDYSIDIFNGWKKLSDSQQEEFKKYFTELTNLQKAIHGAVDSIDSATDAIDDLQEQQEEAYLSLEDRVLNALITKREKEIDAIEELGNSIDNANSKIISNLQQQVQLQRQARDNAKTEQSINDKEARLAFLRRDTSGANALEIMKLEKEIEEDRQNYSDTLVDQAIDEMQREADKAAEQRQTQIQIMRDQLEMQKENGELWGEVHYLIDSAIDSEGNIKSNSELIALLKDTDEFTGLSERGQLNWLSLLQHQILSALTSVNGNSNYSDRFSTEGSRILTRHAEGGAKDDTDEKILARLYTLYRQSNSKSTFLDWINGLGSRKFEQWELTLAGYASGGLADFTGPAWLDGTHSKPEMVLSPTDTQNFLMLRDILARAYAPNGTAAASGDFYFDIDINAELGSDYDVDQLAEQLERKITESAEYRNVNTMNYLR